MAFDDSMEFFCIQQLATEFIELRVAIEAVHIFRRAISQCAPEQKEKPTFTSWTTQV